LIRIRTKFSQKTANPAKSARLAAFYFSPQRHSKGKIKPSLPRRHFLAGTENLLRWMIFESLLGTLMRLHKSPARPANLHAGGIFAIFSVCGQFVHY
jgi:hypothetical protein